MSTERGGGPGSDGGFFGENKGKPFSSPNHGGKRNKPIPPPPAYTAVGIAHIEEFLRGNTDTSIIDNQYSIPDRPAQLDFPASTHRVEALDEIFQKTGGNPEKITFFDLATIIEAEKKDLLTQQNSFDRIAAATAIAKEFFMDPYHPRKVNVSLEQNDEGGWNAKLHARKGMLYYTFTPSGIINSRLERGKYLQELDSLDSASKAVEKIIKGEKLDANGDDAQDLYQFMFNKLREAIATADNSDTFHLIANANATRILLERLALRVFSYPRSKTPK